MTQEGEVYKREMISVDIVGTCNLSPLRVRTKKKTWKNWIPHLGKRTPESKWKSFWTQSPPARRLRYSRTIPLYSLRYSHRGSSIKVGCLVALRLRATVVSTHVPLLTLARLGLVLANVISNPKSPGSRFLRESVPCDYLTSRHSSLRPLHCVSTTPFVVITAIRLASCRDELLRAIRALAVTISPIICDECSTSFKDLTSSCLKKNWDTIW